MPLSPAAARRRPRGLAHDLVEQLGDRIRDGRLPEGAKLPTEAEIVEAFGVSRTVVREAISRLQAAGLVATRHGIGTFVLGLGEAASFRVDPERLATLRDVVALLELRIGIETEAAALAALRRSDAQLGAMRRALKSFAEAVEGDSSAVGPDFQFHLEIARATRNEHFARLMESLGTQVIPRARLHSEEADPGRRGYLLRVNTEHDNIVAAIERQDPEAARAAMRTHLANSLQRRMVPR